MPLLAPRLPGVRFAAVAPQRDEALPRMDVAVFVGFASSGPVDVPVAVEDPSEFREIFGPDLYLGDIPGDERTDPASPPAPESPAVTPARVAGRRVYAHLGPAVRDFFRNGGRRCWVVRVAGPGARALRLPVPGLLRVSLGGDANAAILPPTTPAFARARSEGSWAGAVTLSTALLSDPLGRAAVVSAGAGRLTLQLGAAASVGPGRVIVGDLLRISFGPDSAAYVVVTAADAGTGARVTCRPVVWHVAPPAPNDPGLLRVSARVYAPARDTEASSTFNAIFVSRDETGMMALDCELPEGDPLRALITSGSWVRADFGDRQLWLNVLRTRGESHAGSPSDAILRVVGRGAWLAPPQAWPQASPPSPQASPEDALPTVERLRFELWAHDGNADPLRLRGLGFAAGHPEFWADLPDDAALFRAPSDAADPADAVRHKATSLRRLASRPRFPAAGERYDPNAPPVFIPVGMPAIPDRNGARPTRTASTSATDDPDGLSTFDASLFLDSGLIGTSTLDLMTRADFLRYQSDRPRPLCGLHAALAVAEATLIAVPDAVHTGWEWATDDEDPVTLVGEETKEAPADEKPFNDCGTIKLRPPEFDLVASGLTDAGRITIAWHAPDSLTEAIFVLEEFTRPDMSDAIEFYRGPDRRTAVFGRGGGNWLYRVRAVVGCNESGWSRHLRVLAGPQARRDMTGETRYDPGTLLAVHRSLMRACAARGDLVAVLSVPGHYREDHVLDHAARLRSRPPRASGAAPDDGEFVLPLTEPGALSYGAVYHPWPIVLDETRGGVPVAVPPDGVACGLIAGRAVRRGAWVAPANERLSGVVALAPPIAIGRRLDLQEGRVNLLRQEPRGFLVLDEDTLSDDPDLRPLNVRRLMILLRRLALRLGETYVFEPNSDSFRRSVGRGFERVLEGLLVRGAFAGATAKESFRVVTDSTLNTPQSVDLGRFIVEIRVAPSLPLRFLTVRMVRTGDSGFTVEGP